MLRGAMGSSPRASKTDEYFRQDERGSMISVQAESFRLAEVFTISRGSRTEAKVLTVRVARDGVTGWGECVPYARYDETLESVAAQIAALGSDQVAAMTTAQIANLTTAQVAARSTTALTGLGSDNIDSRLRAADFSNAAAGGAARGPLEATAPPRRALRVVDKGSPGC